MQQQLPSFRCQQVGEDMEYRTVVLPPLAADPDPGSYFTLFDEPSNAFFVCGR